MLAGVEQGGIATARGQGLVLPDGETPGALARRGARVLSREINVEDHFRLRLLPISGCMQGSRVLIWIHERGEAWHLSLQVPSLAQQADVEHVWRLREESEA